MFFLHVVLPFPCKWPWLKPSPSSAQAKLPLTSIRIHIDAHQQPGKLPGTECVWVAFVVDASSSRAVSWSATLESSGGRLVSSGRVFEFLVEANRGLRAWTVRGPSFRSSIIACVFKFKVKCLSLCYPSDAGTAPCSTPVPRIGSAWARHRWLRPEVLPSCSTIIRICTTSHSRRRRIPSCASDRWPAPIPPWSDPTP